MVLGLFKKRDPVCGMTQEKGKGFIDSKTGKWFCSEHCKEEFDKGRAQEKAERHSCCH